MPELTLKTAVGNYGHTAPLKDGTVASEQVALDHVEVSPIIAVFRRMIRDLEFDVSEMSLSTYLCAKAHEHPITAIPIFVARGLLHGSIVYNTQSGIKSPKDIEGRRVGVRGYTVTTGVWVRGVLRSVYGVDLDKVTWVINSDEHVAEYLEPSNVVSSPEDISLADMLLSGDIHAAIGVGNVDSPDIVPLIPDPRQAAIQYFKDSGVYPINHTIIIKDEYLDANPWLPEELFSMFKAAKDSCDSLNLNDEAMQRIGAELSTDPTPYGLEANRTTLERFVEFNVDQKVIPSAVRIEDMFAKSTLGLG